jgi:hypothetical protein
LLNGMAMRLCPSLRCTTRLTLRAFQSGPDRKALHR